MIMSDPGLATEPRETGMAEVSPSTTFSTSFHYPTSIAGTAASSERVSIFCWNKHCIWAIVYKEHSRLMGQDAQKRSSRGHCLHSYI